MADTSQGQAKTVLARASVRDDLLYTGERPDITDVQPVIGRYSPWHNSLKTLAVVVVACLTGTVIFWPQSAGTFFSPAWVTPALASKPLPVTPTPTAPPAEPGVYVGPPRSGVAMPKGDLAGWQQTFTEDFTGVELEPRWKVYNGQPAGDRGGWFLPSHASTSNGRLVISGYREKTPNGNIYATGGVSNSPVFSQVYGKFAFRFRMDAGYGINYILLLWPTNDSWPPEINIAEDDGRSRSLITSTLHHGGHGKKTEMINRAEAGTDFTKWHTVGLEWTPGKLVFLLDGREWTNIVSPEVPKTPMSIALQSQAWPCNFTFSDCPNATTPTVVNMEVDWAVAYAYKPA